MLRLIPIIFALVAFAANSVFCRLALGSQLIDPFSFTAIRLLSGSIMLLFIVIFMSKYQKNQNLDLNKCLFELSITKGHWLGSFYLFSYAIAFSFAYVSLDTGTGALILFASVQLTMIFYALIKGHRLSTIEWLGAFTAFGGFLYLVLPGVQSPNSVAFLLMTLSGVAWAGYTLVGQNNKQSMTNAITQTTANFLKTVPLLFITGVLIGFVKTLFIESVNLPSWFDITLTQQGVLFAILSGCFASAMGYSLWYIALKHLSVFQASVLQLSVPILAAIGGVLWANEAFTQRLIIATILVVCGISLVLYSRQKTH